MGCSSSHHHQQQPALVEEVSLESGPSEDSIGSLPGRSIVNDRRPTRLSIVLQQQAQVAEGRASEPSRPSAPLGRLSAPPLLGLPPEMQRSQSQTTLMPSSPARLSVKEIALKLSPESDISAKDIQMGCEIASGQFAVVSRGLLYGQKVAVKQLRLDSGADGLLEDLRHEVAVMSSLRHPSLLALLGATDDPKRPAIVLEYRDGTLYDALHGSLTGRGVPIDEAGLLRIGQDVLAGMAYLHTRPSPIIHRDLKPPNVLCDERVGSKLADFGTAQPLETPTERLSECVGTALYMAPEVEAGRPYGLKADAFSFACMMYECYYYLEHGKDFYEGMGVFTGLDVLRSPMSLSPPQLPQRPVSCSCGAMWRLLVAGLSADELERPSFVKASHKWSEIRDALSGGASTSWLAGVSARER